MGSRPLADHPGQGYAQCLSSGNEERTDAKRGAMVDIKQTREAINKVVSASGNNAFTFPRNNRLTSPK